MFEPKFFGSRLMGVTWMELDAVPQLAHRWEQEAEEGGGPGPHVETGNSHWDNEINPVLEGWETGAQNPSAKLFRTSRQPLEDSSGSLG